MRVKLISTTFFEGVRRLDVEDFGDLARVLAQNWEVQLDQASLTFVDDEDDVITISSDKELQEAAAVFDALGRVLRITVASRPTRPAGRTTERPPHSPSGWYFSGMRVPCDSDSDVDADDAHDADAAGIKGIAPHTQVHASGAGVGATAVPAALKLSVAAAVDTPTPLAAAMPVAFAEGTVFAGTAPPTAPPAITDLATHEQPAYTGPPAGASFVAMMDSDTAAGATNSHANSAGLGGAHSAGTNSTGAHTNTWACPVCTFVNTEQLGVCEACGTTQPRPTATLAAANPTAAATASDSGFDSAASREQALLAAHHAASQLEANQRHDCAAAQAQHEAILAAAHVKVEWRGAEYNAVVADVRHSGAGGAGTHVGAWSYKVSFVGFGPKWDEWAPPHRVRPAALREQALGVRRAPVEGGAKRATGAVAGDRVRAPNPRAVVGKPGQAKRALANAEVTGRRRYFGVDQLKVHYAAARLQGCDCWVNECDCELIRRGAVAQPVAVAVPALVAAHQVAAAAQAFEVKLQSLLNMGFSDMDRCRVLLRQNDGHVHQVVAKLLE